MKIFDTLQKTNNMQKFLTIFLFTLLTSYTQSQTIHQNYSYEAVSSQGSLYVDDLDNDGVPEVITLIKDFSITKFIVYKYINGTFLEVYRSKRSVFPDGFLGTVHIFDKNKDGIKDLLFCDSSGNTLGLDGNTFEPIFQFNSNVFVYGSILANIDEDGLKNDLVSSALLTCYNLSTEKTLWKGFNGTVYNLMAGDVDGDLKDDLIYSHSLFDSISVFDPFTQKVKWDIKPDSLGPETSSGMRLIDADGDGTKEILIKNGGQITILEGVNHTVINRFKVLNNILSVVDVDGDGKEELLIRDHYKFHIYDCLTGMIISTINNPFDLFSSKIGDFDPNPGLEIIIQSPDKNINLVMTSLLSGDTLAIDYNKQYPINLLPFRSISDNSKKIVRYNFLVEENKYNNYLSINDLEADTVEFQRKFNAIKGNGIRPGKFFSSDERQIMFYGDSIHYLTQEYLGTKIYFISTEDLHTISEIKLPFGISHYYIEDTDEDGVDEIWAKIGNSIQRFEYNGLAFDQTLIHQFDSHFYPMGFFNLDNDPQFEFVYALNITSSPFPGYDTVFIFDIKDKIIQQQIATKFGIHHAQTGTDPVSGKKLLYTVFNGQISGFDPLTGELVTTGGIVEPLLSPPPFIIKNIDEDPEEELITFNLSGQIIIRSMKDFKLLNEVRNQPGFNRMQQFEVFDAFNDDHIDIVVSDENGAIWFSLNETFTDSQLPKVTKNNLHLSSALYPTNFQPVIYFSEPIDPSTVNSNTIKVSDASGNSYQTSHTLNDKDTSLTIEINDILPEDEIIEIELIGLQDIAGNPLDGNGNKKADGNIADKYVVNFKTGSGSDLNGPVTYGNSTDYYKIRQHQNIIIPLHFRDTLDNFSSDLYKLEYFLDVQGNAGTGIEFCEFIKHSNAFSFDVKLSIETKSITPGLHTIYFHALDGSGNWGNIYEIKLEVIAPGNAWYTQGGNSLRNGYANKSKAGYVFKERWTTELQGKDYKTAVCAEGKVVLYEISPDKRMTARCFDEKNGLVNWERIVNENVEKVLGATYGIGNYYLTFFNDSSITKTLCIALESGELIWSHSGTGQLCHIFQPLYHDGDLFMAGDVNGDVYSINATDGYVNWRTDLSEEYNQFLEAHTLDAPVIIKDTLFISSSYEIYKINKNTGQILKSYYLSTDPADTRYSPTVIDSVNNRLIHSRSDFYYIVKTEDLSLPAGYRTASVVQPAVKGDTLFMEIFGQIIGKTTREYNLQFFKDQQFRSYIYPFTLSQNYLYASTKDSMYLFDNRNGELKNTINYSGMVSLTDSSLIIIDTIRNKITVLENDLELSNKKSDISSQFSSQAIPNPFYKDVKISFNLPHQSSGEINFYDVMGRKIECIKSLKFNQGINEFIWEKPGLVSGTYMYTIIAGDNIYTGKMIHIESN